jgi:hypothetical protein
MFSNEYFEWGAQGYAAPAFGFVLAYIFTVLPLKFVDWLARRRARNAKRL